jgi:adenosine deaminase
MIHVPATYKDVYKADMHVHGRMMMKYWAMAQAMRQLDMDPAINAPGFHTQEWNGLLAFHTEYERVYSRLVQTPDDMYEAALNYFRQCAAEKCIYSEVSMTLRRDEPGKPSSEAMLEAMTYAIRAAHQQYGIEARLIANIVRDFGGEEALRVAKQAVYLRDTKFPHIVGIGMSGNELSPVPLEEYVSAYKYAIEAGLLGTAHAGEVTKKNLIDTLKILGPYLRRVGHGVTALEDDELLGKYATDMVLEICLTVNRKLSKYKDLSLHPAPHLWDAGYMLTLGTDNPGPLKTSIGNEYRLAHKICGFSLLQLAQITTAAIKHSFADEFTKQRLLAFVRAQKKDLEMAQGSTGFAPALIVPGL